MQPIHIDRSPSIGRRGQRDVDPHDRNYRGRQSDTVTVEHRRRIARNHDGD